MNESELDVPTIYIIEDDADVRSSVECLVVSGGYQFESFASVEDFLMKETQPHIVGCMLLDFHLQGCDGMAFLKRYLEQPNSHPVIVLTAHADVPIAVQFMKMGASMLLRKPYQAVDLLASIESAITWDRRMHIDRVFQEKISEGFRKLTKRQIAVLDMVLEGAPNKSVAGQLKVSERTIEMERAEILKIFEVKNSVELAVVITQSRLRKSSTSGQPDSSNSEAVNAIAEPHLLSRLSFVKKSSIQN